MTTFREMQEEDVEQVFLNSDEFGETCSIYRFSGSGVDAHGQPTGDWEAVAEDVACLASLMGTPKVVSRDGLPVEIEFDVLLPAGTDVAARDRIAVSGMSDSVEVVLAWAGDGGIAVWGVAARG